MTDDVRQAAPGILISLDTLIEQRTEQPSALDEAPVALRRIGWMGRPIILTGQRVAGRELPRHEGGAEAWVRAALGPGAYAVVTFEDPLVERGVDDGAAIEPWRTVAEAHGATWLVTDRPIQVGPARRAGLMVTLIGPRDPQARLQRPNYYARDLRDAVGHLLTEDVFAHPTPASGGMPTTTE